MISIPLDQLNAWIAAFIYPVARILGFAASATILNSAGMPARVRLILGLALAVGITPSLPPIPAIVPTSGPGILTLINQILIGIGMGVSMRIVFAGIEMAGQTISNQMGLGFATFYDPLSTSQTAVISNFSTLLASLLFLSLNGHLVYFATLAESFRVIPISPVPLGVHSWKSLFISGRDIFLIGTILSLPVITALLITNLSLGVLNKAAPQLNLFAIGFPITLSIGFVGFALSLNYMAAPLEHFFNEAIVRMLNFALSAKTN